MNLMDSVKIDGLAKSPKTVFSVIPAEAGIQEEQALPDPNRRLAASGGLVLSPSTVSSELNGEGSRAEVLGRVKGLIRTLVPRQVMAAFASDLSLALQ